MSYRPRPKNPPGCLPSGRDTFEGRSGGAGACFIFLVGRGAAAAGLWAA